MDGIHRRMDGKHRRMDGKHLRMDGIHRRMYGIHRRMYGKHRRMEGIHRRMDETQRQMEGKQRQMDGKRRRLQCRVTRLRVRVSFSNRINIYFSSPKSRPALWHSQRHIPIAQGLALSLRMKRLGPEADQSPPTRAELKNAWSCTSTSPYFCKTLCSLKHMKTLTLLKVRARRVILK